MILKIMTMCAAVYLSLNVIFRWKDIVLSLLLQHDKIPWKSVLNLIKSDTEENKKKYVFIFYQLLMKCFIDYIQDNKTETLY